MRENLKNELCTPIFLSNIPAKLATQLMNLFLHNLYIPFVKKIVCITISKSKI